MNKKIIQSSEQIDIDCETGEIKSIKKDQTFSIPQEPPYIKMYLQDLQRFYELPVSSSEMIYELLRKLDYDNLISLNSTNKKAMCEKLNWKMGSLDNYLSKLVKCGLFKKEGTGTFRPDPNIFGRGSWSDIFRQRETWIKVTHTPKGRKIKTSFSEEEEQKEE